MEDRGDWFSTFVSLDRVAKRVADRKLNNGLVNASWKITGPFARPTVKRVTVLVFCSFFHFSFLSLRDDVNRGTKCRVLFSRCVFFYVLDVFFFLRLQRILRSILIISLQDMREISRKSLELF